MAKRRSDLNDIMNVAFYDSKKKKDVRLCDIPGCNNPGEHKAPKHRTMLREYYYFCLEHVKDYNARWDYYAGMSAAAVEADVRSASTWERETRPFGGNRSRAKPPEELTGMGALAAEVRHALVLLGIHQRCDFTAIKLRYKELAKKYHPDRAGPGAENTLKNINAAYTTLKKYAHLFEPPPPSTPQ